MSCHQLRLITKIFAHCQGPLHHVPRLLFYPDEVHAVWRQLKSVFYLLFTPAGQKNVNKWDTARMRMSMLIIIDDIVLIINVLNK